MRRTITTLAIATVLAASPSIVLSAEQHDAHHAATPADKGSNRLADGEVRKILASYARPAPEGSPQWEILYQKTRDEVRRRRFRL